MRTKWTKEKCKDEALKYEFRSDFQKKSKSAYHASIKYEILDDICSHMKSVGNLYKRCIYAYEFDDNFVYVGLTFNLYKRHKEHLKKGVVYDHININDNYILKKLTEYVDVNLAKQLEFEYVKKYIENDFLILNIAKTGSVGSISKWTKEKCHEEALKYTSRFEFQKKSSGAYNYAFLNKYLNDICSHMKSRIWTKEKCQEEALKYKSKIEYRKKSSGSYSSALRNKWLDDICSHMTSLIKRDYWSFDKCQEESLKCINKTEFTIKYPYLYKLAKKNDWFNKLKYKQ